MIEATEEFDLTSEFENPVNTFKVVHIYNKHGAYHLTRQILINSALTQDTYTFFYHILTKTQEEFNNLYSSFACLIPRSPEEADIFLNVNPVALDFIIDYIQTGNFVESRITGQFSEMVGEIIDLSTILGIPTLVTKIRALHQ